MSDPDHALPSINMLRAFETAAHHHSFTLAAVELHQTQGAISHQIRALEARLGVKLFEREGRGIRLTNEGRVYLSYTREALDRLRSGAEVVARSRWDKVLNVSVSPNFAAKWLVPRLGRFSDTHPHIDLRISASPQHVRFKDDDIDLAVRHGDGDWPHLSVQRLCREHLLAVCSPTIVRGERAIVSLDDLRNHVLIHDQDRAGWERWLANFVDDLRGFDLHAGPLFNQTSLAIDAAVAGQGIALARSALVALDLAEGRLIRPVDESIPAKFAYWIVCPKSSAKSRKTTLFTEWLIGEANHDAIRAQGRPC